MIGDAYVVADGLLLGGEKEDNATAIINMAFDMREETAKVKVPSKDTTLQVHTSIFKGQGHSIFQHFHKCTNSTLEEGGKIVCTLKNMGINILEYALW